MSSCSRTATPVAPADFDRNGSTDISVFRPSDGSWQIRNQTTVFLGAGGDIPVACDYSGDGRVETAVFRPAVGGWFVNGAATAFFGLSGTSRCRQTTTATGSASGLFRPSVGGWYIQNQPTVFFGLNGDVPVPGDYDGNGSAEVGCSGPRWGAGTEWPRAHSSWVSRPTSPSPATTTATPPRTWPSSARRPERGTSDQAPVFFGLSTDLPVPLPSAIRMAAGP